jgi:hypothetical protein
VRDAGLGPAPSTRPGRSALNGKILDEGRRFRDVLSWFSMPKTKKAREEGFKRGLAGKTDASGVFQGWTDDKASGIARNEGWVAGKRKKAKDEAEAARIARAKK